MLSDVSQDDKNWLEISILVENLDRNSREIVRTRLAECCGGIEEVSEENGAELIKGYLAATDTGKATYQQLVNDFRSIEQRNSLPPDSIFDLIQTQYIQNVDWATNWKQYYRPQRIGKHFVVYPSWEQPDDLRSGDNLILLDPGQAFGTGQHETTKVCMSIMESLPMNGWRVADVGCGSGILSIAAKLLGAGDVYGVDIDPVAVETAGENLKKNNISANVFISAGSVQTLKEAAPFDLVIANIVSDVLLEIGADLRDITCKDGLLLWSGIIADQAQNVENYIASLGLTIHERRAEGEWFGYLLKRAG